MYLPVTTYMHCTNGNGFMGSQITQKMLLLSMQFGLKIIVYCSNIRRDCDLTGHKQKTPEHWRPSSQRKLRKNGLYNSF